LPDAPRRKPRLLLRDAPSPLLRRLGKHELPKPEQPQVVKCAIPTQWRNASDFFVELGSGRWLYMPRATGPAVLNPGQSRDDYMDMLAREL
jgi:hypothetical protein